MPRVPFAALKKAVLGNRFELSLVLLSPKEALALNKKIRMKNRPFNVLSFLLSSRSGEIFLCPSVAKKEASQYRGTPKDFLIYLFIHGMLHIKGMDHGATMEKREQRFLKRFGATIVL